MLIAIGTETPDQLLQLFLLIHLSKSSFLPFLLLLSSSSLLPRQVLVLDVLDGVVELYQLFLLALLFYVFVPFLFLSLELPLFFLSIPFFENFQFCGGLVNVLGEQVNLLFQLFLASLSLGGELLTLFF